MRLAEQVPGDAGEVRAHGLHGRVRVAPATACAGQGAGRRFAQERAPADPTGDQAVRLQGRAVLTISDRTYVLAGGEVRMEGTPAELAASPAFVGSFLGGTVSR